MDTHKMTTKENVMKFHLNRGTLHRRHEGNYQTDRQPVQVREGAGRRQDRSP